MIRDTRMMSRALVQRWELSPDERRKVIDRLLWVLETSDKPREITAAAKGLMAAELQNQTDEHKIVDAAIQQEHNRLDAVADELGIEVGVIEAVTRKAGSGDCGDEASRNADDREREGR